MNKMARQHQDFNKNGDSETNSNVGAREDWGDVSGTQLNG